MGACDFYVEVKAPSARAAFREAQEEARYAHGHEGYTGTIAEKDSMKRIYPREGETPAQCVDRYMGEDTFSAKWGPAGCIELEEGRWAFFGMASS